QHTQIEQPTVSVSQPTIAQSMQQQNPYVPTVSSGVTEKRKKNPLLIVDSVSHKLVEVSGQSAHTTTTTPAASSTIITSENRPIKSTTTDSVITNIKSTNYPHKTKTQADFLQQFERLQNSFNSQTNKSNDPIPVLNKEINSNPPESQSTPPLSETTSLESVTPRQTSTTIIINNAKSQALPKQRLRYDRNELLRIRENYGPFPIPQNLPELDIVLSRHDNNNPHYSYTGTNSQGCINPSFHRQLSSSNHPSLTGYPNNQNSSSDSRRKTGIYLTNEPNFGNRNENPCRPIDQSKIDANSVILRDVESILNNITPQTYDELQKKLQKLEIDSYERLEGMITIVFSKAVDEPVFSFLYAKLCKQFQKKQVIVIGKDGKITTCYFRQILLTRCQNVFQNDYRQEIGYEQRKTEVEAITDEKKHKEQAEKLEQNIIKAQRRKLGNIIFIGELFKLQMLTDAIIYDCIQSLLRDKTNEENLVCLCALLRTVGHELDTKANEKPKNKSSLKKYYHELEIIVKEQKISARICFMIRDVLELREAAWVIHRVATKPTTIDEILKQEYLKNEQPEYAQEHERQQCRDQNCGTVIGNVYSESDQQQYEDERGSGIKQQSNRNEEDRTENRFTVNSLRQLQSNDKRNQEPFTMSLAPQRTWPKGSDIEKKPEEDGSFGGGRTGKLSADPVQQLKGKIGSSQSGSTYSMQRQSARELERENSQRNRENASQLLRKKTTSSGVNSSINTVGTSSMTNSHEDSRNVSYEQYRNASRESSVSERMSNVGLSIQMNKTSTNESPSIINQDPSNTS
ncbi:unnamed protein product, partial [Rotaria sp. Silwood2]